MVRLALTRIILCFSILAAVGWVLSFVCAFFRLLMTSLHLSLNQRVLSFTGLNFLLGVVLFAIVHEASVKLSTGSAALIIQSAFKSEAALSAKVSQSDLLSFQLLLVTDGTALWEWIITGKWSLPQRSSWTLHEKSKYREGSRMLSSIADWEPEPECMWQSRH